jgi:hypothetical protein
MCISFVPHGAKNLHRGTQAADSILHGRARRGRHKDSGRDAKLCASVSDGLPSVPAAGRHQALGAILDGLKQRVGEDVISDEAEGEVEGVETGSSFC